MIEELDLSTLAESVDIECKAAQGRDGVGEVPLSFWESYVAMANTNGGQIFLGIQEPTPGVFKVLGLKNPEHMQKTIWDTLHNKSKVSLNVLVDSDIQVQVLEGKNVLTIRVPKASRKVLPIYIGPNPIDGTYLRRHEGDYHADEETVKRMLAEALEDSRDDRLIPHMDMQHLDKATVAAYRNRFRISMLNSPWAESNDEEFLMRIGAMAVDPTTGKCCLRLAGLLMFGEYHHLRGVLPYYFLDYQEKPTAEGEARWLDRIVPDSTWSGNLYDFFMKVYRKLVADLKVPFQLKDGVRIDETPVHEALREALTNSLIHADYTGRIALRIVKKASSFSFRNPGLIRVGLDQALLGGKSDCRNRHLQDMFRYIGFGDDAGSGIPKILQTWNGQHYRPPYLSEDLEFYCSQLDLHMESLVSDEVLVSLNDLFGSRFQNLHELERLILITAHVEQCVNHSRIRGISTVHSKDISLAFARLVQGNMLQKEGETRASMYYLPSIPTNSPQSDDSIPISESSIPISASDIPISAELLNKKTQVLTALGLEVMPARATVEQLNGILLAICDQFIEIRQLATLVERQPKTLRDKYLNSLVSDGLLEMKFPAHRKHPHQAYRRAK